MSVKKRGSNRKTLSEVFPGIEQKKRQLENGDRVEFKKGEEQILVCCHCGASHLIYFDRDCVMSIWDPLSLAEEKR